MDPSTCNHSDNRECPDCARSITNNYEPVRSVQNAFGQDSTVQSGELEPSLDGSTTNTVINGHFSSSGWSAAPSLPHNDGGTWAVGGHIIGDVTDSYNSSPQSLGLDLFQEAGIGILGEDTLN